jgi:hypothetical protein
MKVRAQILQVTSEFPSVFPFFFFISVYLLYKEMGFVDVSIHANVLWSYSSRYSFLIPPFPSLKGSLLSYEGKVHRGGTVHKVMVTKCVQLMRQECYQTLLPSRALQCVW